MNTYEFIGTPRVSPSRRPAIYVFCGLSLVVLVFCAGLVCSHFLLHQAVSDTEVAAAFESFMSEYGRDYVSAEEQEKRKDVFSVNYQKIQEINNAHLPFTLAINQFADLTDDEFRERYLTEHPVPDSVLAQAQTLPLSEPLTIEELEDDDIDWVRDGLVTPVKDQGMCGSCWTFGSISTVESRYAKVTGSLNRFSEQELVDCCKLEGSDGCNGGSAEAGLTYLLQKGVAFNAEYPYVAMDQACKIDEVKELVKAVEGFTVIAPGDAAQIQRSLHSHTMYISVNSGSFVFRFYRSGVITEGCPSAPLSHGITLVGSGTTKDGTPFWKVRNSWGPNWGDHGYAYIKRDLTSTGPGLCGICRHAVFPLYKE